MRFWSLLPYIGLAFLSTACSEPACHPKDCIDQTYVHKYGVKVRPDYWVDRGQNGQVVSTLRDGVVITQNYSAGNLHGDCCYTFPGSNKIAKTEEYDNNAMRKVNEFYHSGAPKQSCEWTGPKSYTITCWYECGTPRSIEKYEDGHLINGEYYNRNNLRDSWVYNGEGERLTRDCSGCFLCLDDFCGGELVRRTYFYNGNSPREIISFMNGVPHGERKTYYPDGSPCSSESWDHGKQNGTTVIYRNGDRYAEIPYLDGKKNGVERRYSDGYNLSQEITWYNDKMHGPTYTYDGDSVLTDWFYAGRMTSRSNYESHYMPCM